MADCLHRQIKELFRAHLECDVLVDLNDLAVEFVECAAELRGPVAT
jgi:hypothetical protein